MIFGSGIGTTLAAVVLLSLAVLPNGHHQFFSVLVAAAGAAATVFGFSVGASFFALSEPKGHQSKPLSFLASAKAGAGAALAATGAEAFFSAGLVTTASFLSTEAGASAWSDAPSCHHLWPPSASFCGVCAQPVIARHRAKARVLLDDIEYPHNELEIIGRDIRIKKRIKRIKATVIRPTAYKRVLQTRR